MFQMAHEKMHVLISCKIFLFFIFFYSALCGYSVQAADLHVGSGQTYSTIGAAITASSSSDTIIVHTGTYNETDLRPKSNTTIQGAAGETRPIIDAQQSGGTTAAAFNIKSSSNITLEDLDIRGGGGYERGTITIGNEGTGTSNITIEHCKVSETNIGGTLTSYNPAHIRIGRQEVASYITIQNCEIFGSYASGIKGRVDGSGGGNLTVKNNYIYDVLHGVALKWGDTNDRTITIENNIFQDCSERAFYIDQSYVSISNNVIDTAVTGIYLRDNFGGSDCTISHNTFYGCGVAYFMRKSGDNNTFSYNIRYSNNKVTDYGSGNSYANDFTTYPDFVDAPGGDFTLDTGSGAIGTADNGSAYGADLDLVGIVDSGSVDSRISPPKNFFVVK